MKKRGNREVAPSLFLTVCSLVTILLLGFISSCLAANDSICAQVRIEIQQELTLERQAFDAHMRINNGLDQISIENVAVEVTFLDESGNTVRATTDPYDTTALFFFRLNSMQNISSVDGTGAVTPATSADIHWLIIPAPGASKGKLLGTLYYVGATLGYTLGGDQHLMQVSPDFIFVKPMPEISLDYFFPAEVYGDDAFTPQIEPPVPFSLGVRVSNNGCGTARNLRIDSAQPKVVDNRQGLPIDFSIQGGEVDGREADKSLLANFGDIVPGAKGLARWIMACTLSGRFVGFSAELSHADELGGEVTSIMDAVTTHYLLRDVVVDLPGRDSIRDFLAKDGGIFRVYESEGLDTQAVNQSASSNLQLKSQQRSETSYTLTSPVTAGFMVVFLPDPEIGKRNLKEVLRSDGKRIKPENAWLSKVQDQDGLWSFFFNLFDVNTSDSYTVIFIDPEAQAHPPVLDPIPNLSGIEGVRLSFEVSASDPDGTIPTLSASPLPALSSFTDRGDGTAVFDWTPATGQAGQYEITFKASDVHLSGSTRASIKICPPTDSDCDGLADEWEMRYFGTLERNGAGDYDGDGVTDLDEYLNGKDPTVKNVPTIPRIASPGDREETTDLQPDLAIFNSMDPDGDPVSYAFELYADPSMKILIAGEPRILPGAEITSWTVPGELVDNSWYTWRVRASDGKGVSEWANGKFFVNMANDPPGNFGLSSPSDGAEVDRLTPVLAATAASDVDEDPLTYFFEVYADPALKILVASASNVREGADGVVSWAVNVPLSDNTRYFWRALAVDGHGASTFTPTFSFFVNTANDAPLAPVIVLPAPGTEVTVQALELVAQNAVDIDGDELTCAFELDRVNTFDSPNKMSSGVIVQGADTTRWAVSNLSDNTRYHFRVRASDGAAESPWASGSFFVNVANDAPSLSTVKNPGEGAWVQSLTPTLEVTPALDADGDALSYQFEVYDGKSSSSLITRGSSGEPRWVLPFELANDVWYSWRAQTVDEHGAESGWVAASFFTDSNGVNDLPEMVLKTPSGNIFTQGGPVPISWEDSDPDSNAEISLSYGPDQVVNTTLMISSLPEDPDGPDDTFLWDSSLVPEGTYSIVGTITDGTSSATSTAPGVVIVDRTAPTVEAKPSGDTCLTAQSVTLSASESSTIYFTLDGSDPTIASPQYAFPIPISATTTLKFVAVDRAGNASPVVSETYDIQDKTLILIYGSGQNYPVNAADRATFQMYFQGPLHPLGWLAYSYRGRSAVGKKWMNLSFLSTAVTSIAIRGNTAVISGTGWMISDRRCTFTAQVSNGSPDAFGITIKDHRGMVVFSTNPTPLSKGGLEIKAFR